VALLVFGGLGCSKATSTPGTPATKHLMEQMIVAAQGGTITVTEADDPRLAGTSISIPPHALSADTMITIDEGTVSVTPPGDTAGGPVVHFGPDGLAFLTPATITLPYQLPSGGEVDRLAVGIVEANGSRKDLPSSEIRVGSTTLAFAAGGFSNFGVYLAESADAGTDAGPSDAGPDGGAPGIDAGASFLTITPSTASLTVGAMLDLSVSETTPSGTVDVTPIATWNSSDPIAATVSVTGVVTGISVGVVTITATVNGATVSAAISVVNGINEISISPPDPSIPAGQTGQLRVIGTFSDGSTQDLTSSATWASSDTAVATITADGTVTGVSEGTAVITASVEAATAEVVVFVGPPQVVGLSISPAADTLPIGTTLQLSATGTDSDGSTGDVTSQVAWTSSDPTIATVSFAIPGLVVPVAQGVVTISADLGLVGAVTQVTVVSVPVVSMTVSPATVNCNAGNSQQLSATVTFTDATTADVTSQTAWASADTSIAWVSSAGVVNCVAAGHTTVTGTFLTSTVTVSVTVTPAGGPVSLTISPNPASCVAGLTASLQATAVYTDGRMLDLTGSVRWASASSSIATVSSGVVQCLAQGNTTITATFGALSGSATVNVSPPALQSVSVSPMNATCPVGGTLQFTATASYGNGTTADVTAEAAWSSTEPGIATISAVTSGLVTCQAEGTATVSAAHGALSGSAAVNVGNPAPVTLSITGLSACAAGDTEQLTATATWTDGSTTDVTEMAMWFSTNPRVATISSTGLVTCVSPGTTTLQVADSGITGMATLTVGPRALRSIAVTPSPVTCQVGTTEQLTAMGTYSDTATGDLTSQVVWSVASSTIATVSASGLLTCIAPGTTAVTATLDGISGSDSVTAYVFGPTPIVITPSNPNCPAGMTLQLTATGTYSDGSTRDITDSVTWSVADPMIATVSASGLLTCLAPGSTALTATDGGISATANVTVGPPALVSIAVSPSQVRCQQGDSPQLAATGTWSDGTTQDLTSQATWTSGDGAIATVSGGLVMCLNLGEATITATFDEVSGSAVATVQDVPLVSVAVTPNPVGCAPGETVQLSATGTYSDASTNDLTDVVTWTSASTSIATVSSTGLLTCRGVGSTTVSAAVAGITGSMTVNNVGSGLWDFAVTPQNVTCPAGLSVQYSATGTFPDGSTQDLTTIVTWGVSNPSVASISGSGVLSCLSPGTFTVNATYQGILSSASGTVVPTQVLSIALSPSNADVPLGESLQLSATGTFSDGSVADVTGLVSWSSSNPGVAIMATTAPGLVDSVQIGTVLVTASYLTMLGAVSGTTTVTVGPAGPVSITLSPMDPQLPLGTSQQFTALATYSDGTTANVTNNVVWSVSDDTILALPADSPPGLISTFSEGNASVTATMESVNGTTDVTVTPPALVSIAITPAAPTCPLGATIQFAASATWSDGSTTDVTNAGSWITGGGPGPAITGGGLLTCDAGITSVTFTFGAVSATATLVIGPPALESIAVSPSTLNLPAGEDQQFTATGTYSDGSTADITSTVTWLVSDETILDMSSTTAGLAVAIGQGAASVIAVSGQVVGIANVAVGPAILVSISVTPDPDNLVLGEDSQLTATGTFSDSSTVDMTDQVTWSSALPIVATVSSTGLVSTVEQGDAKISATLGAITGSTTVNVYSSGCGGISVTPTNIVCPAGENVQMTAIGEYTDCTQEVITNSVTWNTGNTTVATYSTTTPGLLECSSVGMTTVTATIHGMVASAQVTVTPAVLVSIAITPSNPEFPLTETEQLVATGTWTDRTTQDITDMVTWTSSDSTIAGMSSTTPGLVMSVNVGMVSVTASYPTESGTVTCSTSVTILPVEIASISISPANPTCPLGESIQLAATATYTDGSTVNVTSQGTWGVSGHPGPVIPPGLVPCVPGIGTETITFTLGTISATVTLTIGPPALVSIVVNPSAPTVAEGMTQQFTAIATFTDDHTQDLTSSVTWSTSDATIATIDASGLATAVSSGTADIEATLSSITGSTSLNVQ
jgi:uncharacterized protein YjdB